jgi:hypothetical protein
MRHSGLFIDAGEAPMFDSNVTPHSLKLMTAGMTLPGWQQIVDTKLRRLHAWTSECEEQTFPRRGITWDGFYHQRPQPLSSEIVHWAIHSMTNYWRISADAALAYTMVTMDQHLDPANARNAVRFFDALAHRRMGNHPYQKKPVAAKLGTPFSTLMTRVLNYRSALWQGYDLALAAYLSAYHHDAGNPSSAGLMDGAYRYMVQGRQHRALKHQRQALMAIDRNASLETALLWGLHHELLNNTKGPWFHHLLPQWIVERVRAVSVKATYEIFCHPNIRDNEDLGTSWLSRDARIAFSLLLFNQGYTQKLDRTDLLPQGLRDLAEHNGITMPAV